MKQNKFIQSHPFHAPTDKDIDYSIHDHYFIQCLKAMEVIMDIDAYIVDYGKRRILYATKGSMVRINNKKGGTDFPDFDFFDQFIIAEDLSRVSIVNTKVYEFFYSLPIKRRPYCYFTQDFRIRTKFNKIILVNHKGTVLDLTENGGLRLTLCVISHPTHDKPGNSYLKMTDNQTVYEFMKSTQKFVEVKTQKLTSKATMVLKLASNGKRESEIAEILGISIHTVKYHKKRIFSQIEVKNIAEAIQWMNNQRKMVK